MRLTDKERFLLVRSEEMTAKLRRYQRRQRALRGHAARRKSGPLWRAGGSLDQQDRHWFEREFGRLVGALRRVGEAPWSRRRGARWPDLLVPIALPVPPGLPPTEPTQVDEADMPVLLRRLGVRCLSPARWARLVRDGVAGVPVPVRVDADGRRWVTMPELHGWLRDVRQSSIFGKAQRRDWWRRLRPRAARGGEGAASEPTSAPDAT